MGIRPLYLLSKTPFKGVTHIPVIQIKFLHVTLNLEYYDALVITSKQALLALETYNPEWKKTPVIAISKPTADKAKAMGATLLHVGEGYGKDLYHIIESNFSHLKLCYARAETIVSDFCSKLRVKGIMIDDPIVYRTSCSDEIGDLNLEEDAILIFTSPSAVTCFLMHNDFKKEQKIVVIGSTTQAALPLHVKSEMALEPTVEACVALAHKINEL
jgi:uroporphyrinogen-III synthase